MKVNKMVYSAMLEIATTIHPIVIKIHLNTSIGVIIFLFFLLTVLFNIMFSGLQEGQQLNFPDGNKGKKAN